MSGERGKRGITRRGEIKSDKTIDSMPQFLLQSNQIFTENRIVDNYRQGSYLDLSTSFDLTKQGQERSQNVTTTRGQHLLGKEIGLCVLERLLGYGGSSAVFLARSLTSGEQVAVKVFLPRSTLDGQMRKSFYQRFLREAEAASQLDHPNILSVHAYGEHEGMPYIVMPYMPGGTLSEYIRQHGPLSLPEALSYLEQIAAALDYAHTHGCVHCDVKPANILLDGTGHVALSDFGIVHWLQAETATSADEKAGKKSSETLMGTPDYVSPEQAMGEQLDGRSDVYSLGATLYALLTGEPPFQAETPIALALMHVHEAPAPVGLLRADVTPQVDFVLLKALAKWPEERFQTAGEFAAAFALALKETGEAAQFSLKHSQLAKQQPSGENTLISFTPPAIALPVVQIKRLVSRRVNPWRLGLLLGLVALLLVGCLLTALLIGVITANRQASIKGQPTPASTTPFDPLAQDPQNWPISSTFFFQNHAYCIQNMSELGNPAIAFYAGRDYSNFRLQVTTEEIKGSFNSADYYGVTFRTSADQSRYYLFDVTAWSKGQYGFLRYDGGNRWTTLAYGKVPPGFLIQAGQRNVLGIEATGNTFTFTINGYQAGEPVRDLSNKVLSSGEIGLVVEEQKTEVAFSDLSILPL